MQPHHRNVRPAKHVEPVIRRARLQHLAHFRVECIDVTSPVGDAAHARIVSAAVRLPSQREEVIPVPRRVEHGADMSILRRMGLARRSE